MTIKVITRLLHLVIGLKFSRQFFNQCEGKPNPIAPCARDFCRALSELREKLRVIARNSDWFIVLFVPVAIGWNNYFGFGFSTVI